jgi:hypothetical protein
MDPWQLRDTSIRRALLLSLGEYGLDRLPLSERQAIDEISKLVGAGSCRLLRLSAEASVACVGHIDRSAEWPVDHGGHACGPS